MTAPIPSSGLADLLTLRPLGSLTPAVAAGVRAVAYRYPALFVTPGDATDPDGTARQYAAGRALGAAARTVTITALGSWSAALRDGSARSALHLVVGRFPHSAAWLRGVLDSGVPLRIVRWNPPLVPGAAHYYWLTQGQLTGPWPWSVADPRPIAECGPRNAE